MVHKLAYTAHNIVTEKIGSITIREGVDLYYLVNGNLPREVDSKSCPNYNKRYNSDKNRK